MNKTSADLLTHVISIFFWISPTSRKAEQFAVLLHPEATHDSASIRRKDHLRRRERRRRHYSCGNENSFEWTEITPKTSWLYIIL